MHGTFEFVKVATKYCNLGKSRLIIFALLVDLTFIYGVPFSGLRALLAKDKLKLEIMPGKVAVVTGSNKGIGFAIVKALCLKFDGDVYLTSRNDDRGHEAIKQLESDGLKVKYHQLDIDNVESVKRLRDDMVSSYGGIDVLVNNAAIAFKNADPTPFATQAKVTLATNFFSTLETSKLLLPHIKANGRVVNVSSMSSSYCIKQCSPELQKVFRSEAMTEDELVEKMNEFIAAAQAGDHVQKGWANTAYGVSKLGVTVMSRIHAKWLREQGKNDVLLNACCPGWVKTDMAGPNAPKTPDQGAETPVYLALLPVGATEPHGKMVSEKVVQKL